MTEENTNNKIIKICEFCSKGFRAIPSRPKQRFCSRDCIDSFRAAPVITCENCGKERKIRTSKLQRNKHNFCSRDCNEEFKHKNGNTLKMCKNCNKEFLVKNSEIKRHKTDNYYCSVKCAEEFGFRNGELNPNWIGGVMNHSKGYSQHLDRKNPNSYKSGYVLGHRQVMANILGRPLTKDEVVHHIDENKKNNDPSNLMIMTRKEHLLHHLKKDISNRICKKCKSKTTYTKKNGHQSWFKFEDGFQCRSCYRKEKRN